MKTIATSLLLLSTTSALAHTSIAPHTHNGSETSWLPVVAIVGIAIVLGYALARIVRSPKAQHVSK